LAWESRDVAQERLRFVIRASSGKEEMKALCEEFGISRPTGYLWLKRYRKSERLNEILEKSRRPHESPHKTKAAKEQRVIELRKQYPDWGAAKLAEVLKRENVEIPRITVHRILLRNGLVREQDRHRAAKRRFERGAPNELWQMDFKGPQGFNKGSPVGPLALEDDHSRYLLALKHLGSTKLEGVRDTLQKTFERGRA